MPSKVNKSNIKTEEEKDFLDPQVTKTSMDLVKKHHLDGNTEPEFYRRFFSYLFKTQVIGNKAEDFYNAILKAEEPIQNDIKFYPSILFRFILDDFLMIKIPVSIYVKSFKTCQFEPTAEKSVFSFCNFYKYQPLDSIYLDKKLSREEKAHQLGKIFSFLANERQLCNAKYLTLESYEEIRERLDKSAVSFEDLVKQYDNKRRLLYMESLDSEPKLLDYKRMIRTFTKGFTARKRDHYYISIMRPWCNFESLLIQQQDSTINRMYYGKEIKKGYYEPSLLFYQDYIEKGGRQEGEVFYNASGHRFKIIYSVSNGKWKLQNEKLFAAEKAWKQKPKPIDIDSLRHLKISQLENAESFQLLLKKKLLLALESILDPQTNLSKVFNMLGFSQNWTLYEYLQKFYHLYGRIKREPCAVLHRSFGGKLSECLLAWDKILEAPLEIVFPEYFLYSVEDGQKIDQIWYNSFHNFVCSFLNHQLPLSFALPRPVSLEGLEMRNLDIYSVIFYNGEKVNLLEWDEDYVNPYLDMSIVPYGKAGIGKMCEAPTYWNTKVSKVEQLDKQVVAIVDKVQQLLTEADVDDFIRQLELGTHNITVLEDCEEEQEDVQEEDEVRDQEDPLEFGLDDEEIDVENF